MTKMYINTDPPSYLSNSPHIPSARSDFDLPAYAQNRRGDDTSTLNTHHRYEIYTSNRKAWATLALQSRAISADRIPLFWQGDNIAGSLTLDIEKEDSIKMIKITMQGKLLTGQSSDSWIFLEETKVLWARGMGNPRASPSSFNENYRGKMVGKYDWDFSLSIPAEVTAPPGSSSSMTSQGSGPFRLPQTLLERNIRTGIQYELCVSIKRSRFHPTARIQTMFGYVPLIRPAAPSLLRQLAYQEHSPLLGPDADPDGWQQVSSFTVKGTVFKDREVQVNCVVSLAKPLCYTRGTVIPCFITLTSADTQALNLLAVPSCIPIRLRRHVTDYSPDFAPNSPTEFRRPNTTNVPKRWKVTSEDLGTGVWWPVREDGQEHSKRLNGEIKLSQNLKSTCVIGNFVVQYSVVVLPFSATAFVSEDLGKPLAEFDIEIATAHASGPRPLTYAQHPSDDEVVIRENYTILSSTSVPFA
ncbi:hypothetical protein IW261DRAFT_110475 [Armillaria novae-zelandiae]|uniref:Arrestin-like N-terminal domain-containing protein n=1 Tax=Armillaria novae-zelandiae TaxID=153914 RepID=A0AA39UID8_9AGAR|nr:hypothetical protein IW261DRAFT_110475 [Armillaria novae-zelandiae]